MAANWHTFDHETPAEHAARNAREAAECKLADWRFQPELPINPNSDHSRDWMGDDRRDKGLR